MDLLEDIKRELRGERDDGDSTASDDDPASADDAGTDTGDAGSGSESVARSTTAAGSGPDGESVAGGDETRPNGATAGDSSQGDDHLCSFCETEFDASRDVCPECDAEIVLRGAR